MHKIREINKNGMYSMINKVKAIERRKVRLFR